MLRRLIPSLGRDLHASDRGHHENCAYCGSSGAGWLQGAACSACHLVCNLDRPGIDEEAALVWLPEISQAALNRIVREMHCRLHPSRPSSDPGAHYVRLMLEARGAMAAATLGTGRPSDIALALALLPTDLYLDRQRSLAGLRIMSAGHFFHEGADIYPDLLERWCEDGQSQKLET